MDAGDKITLDRETFKALAVDTRVKILKILDERQQTLSDLAEELSMAPSTIKEHLDTLVAAGLIKQVDKGMKWKYYKLTFKGRELINPYEKKVWIVLATSAVALGVTAYTLLSKIQELGRITVIESFNVAEERSLAPAPGAAQSLLSGPTSDADITNCTIGLPGAGETALKSAENLCDAVSATIDTVTTTVSSVSTTVTDASRHMIGALKETDAVTQIKTVESAAQIPYTEIMFFAVFALITGLCIGYLVKRKRSI